MPYALGQLHNCHHIPPSLPSVPPILTHNPPPHTLGRGGGGVNNNVSIFSAFHEISRTFEIVTPPPQFPWEPPPPPEWGGSTIFFIGFWTVHDISRSFYFPWDPPGGTLTFLGSESEMIVKVVICFTVEPLYLKHASNHKLRLPKLAMLSIRIRHYIVLL